MCGKGLPGCTGGAHLPRLEGQVRVHLVRKLRAGHVGLDQHVLQTGNSEEESLGWR